MPVITRAGFGGPSKAYLTFSPKDSAFDPIGNVARIVGIDVFQSVVGGIDVFVAVAGGLDVVQTVPGGLGDVR
jgi:hypothetical protein